MLQAFESVLDCGPVEREVTVSEVIHTKLVIGIRPVKKRRRTSTSLRMPDFVSAEDHPSYGRIGSFRYESRNRSAATNLDVIGMCAEAKDVQRTAIPRKT
jgi:hypothetical protein